MPAPPSCSSAPRSCSRTISAPSASPRNPIARSAATNRRAPPPRRCLERIEGELAIHADDAKALAFGAAILVDLGQAGRALDWAERAAALDPGDLITSYNLACAWIALGRQDEALTRLEKFFAVPHDARQLHLDWMKHDKALDPLRNHPRYQALVRYLEGDAPPSHNPFPRAGEGRSVARSAERRG